MPERAKPGAAAAGASRVEHLAFVLGGEAYATPVARVQEILRPPPLTWVPHAAEGILGIVSVRGQLVTVVDPRKRLRLEAPPLTKLARVLLVRDRSDELLGVVVEEVLQVLRIAEDEIETRSSALGDASGGHITGIARPTSSARASGSRMRASRNASQAAEPPAPVLVLLDLQGLVAT